MAVAAIVVPAVVPAVVLAIVMPAVIVRSSLCLVIYSGGCSIVMHRCASLCTPPCSQSLPHCHRLRQVITVWCAVAVDKLSPYCSNTTPKSSHFSQVFHSRFSWHNRELEDGRLVEGDNVVIRAGGDKGVNSSWILGLTTVEVDRSVKVRRDSRKRSQPILANIGHFLLPLERVRCNSEYIGKTEFFSSSPPHSATRLAATAFIM
jgi:hypothetical protein